MSHITEFSITGLAGRNNAYSQKLNRDLNIFFGLNGSGKTSLLRILDSAMLGVASVLESVPFKSAEVKFYSVTYDKVFTRRIVRPKTKVKGTPSKRAIASDVIPAFEYSRSNHERPKSELKWKTTPVLPADAPGPFRHTFLSTARLYSDLSNPYAHGGLTPNYITPSEEALDAYFARSLESLWTAYSAEILSKVNKAQQDGLASILKAVLTTKPAKGKDSQKISPEMAYERVSTFLKRQGSSALLGSIDDFLERYKDDQKLRSVVSDINEVERGIEGAMAPRNKLQSLIQNMFGATKVKFQDQNIEITAHNKTKIDLTGLSSGQKHVLKLFIENLMIEESCLMIDEPEISLHVDWQRQLVSSMRQLNPNAQLIMATHSPEIMADIADEKIFRL
jgi:hypothetical protein